MASPLSTNWVEVERNILRPLQAVPLSSVAVVISSDAAGDMGKYRAQVHTLIHSYKQGEDSVLNTLRYMFYHMRCGILVSIRSGSLYLFCPFANARYQNTWHRKLCFRGGNAQTYVLEKSKETRRRPEVWMPTSQWWVNGGILCNVMPEEVWGTFHHAELLEMLHATCASHAVPDCDFFINKRDYPHIKKDGSDPYTAFTGETELKREKYTSYAPIFSFYTGDQFADVPIPLTEDWKLDTAGSTCEGWRDTHQIAIFRGSATGNGILAENNVRIRLVMWAREHGDLVDAEFVSFNFRDKAVRADESSIIVDYIHPEELGLPPLVKWMPLSVQAAGYRYILYADGHCASNRYGALMMTGRTILKIQSTGEANMQWLFYDLIPATVTSEIVDVPPDADHFVILSDLSNLEATIIYLRSHDDVAQAAAVNARSKAPSKEKITSAWATAFQAVGERQAVAARGAGKIWFSPYDIRYSQLGRLDESSRIVSLSL